MDPRKIKTAEPFLGLFAINQPVLKAIVENMTENGFDPANPIAIWTERDCVLDGHTRLQAAIECGLEDVPTVYKSFDDENDAVLYAIGQQKNRRNLSDADLFRWAMEFDKRKMGGRPPKNVADELASREAISGLKSAEVTANAIGTSRAKIERVRYVADHATPEVKQAVLDGTISINKAVNQTRRPDSPPPLPPRQPVVVTRRPRAPQPAIRGTVESSNRCYKLISDISVALTSLESETPDKQGRAEVLVKISMFIHKLNLIKENLIA